MKLKPIMLAATVFAANLASGSPVINSVSPNPLYAPSQGGQFFTGTFIIQGQNFQNGSVTTDGPLLLTGSAQVDATGGMIKQNYSIGCCAPRQDQVFHLTVNTPSGSAGIQDSITLSSSQPTISAAPAGYSWLHIVMLNSEILKPDGWFVVNKRDEFALSKKQIARGADFEAAIFVSVYPVPTNMANFPNVSGYLGNFVNRFVKKENQIDRQMSTNGVCIVLEYRTRDDPKGGKDVTVKNYWYANDKAGKFVHFWFEASTPQWEDEWKIAAPCFQHLKLSESF